MYTNGLFQPSWWGYLAFVLIMTHVTIVTVTVYYHRAVAHRALFVNPKLSLFFRFWGWLTTGMLPREWAMVHRYHHAQDDKGNDPHSPWIYGIWYVLFCGVLLYVRAAKDPDLIAKRNTQDIKRDWYDDNIFDRPEKYARFYGVALMLIIDLILFGLMGLVIWLVQMVWIPFWAAGVINGIGHYPRFMGFLGYRNHGTSDRSSNILPWGVIIGGEELHNNHHAFPASAKLSYKPWEFDIGWLYIRILESLKLVVVKDIHGEKVFERGPTTPDWVR